MLSLGVKIGRRDAANGVHCTGRTAEVQKNAGACRYNEHMPLVLLNKPFRVLSQFTDAQGRETLADYVSASDVYPAGRLDADSEGLILLTDDGRLQARISQPASKVVKAYWAQVEGEPDEDQLKKLVAGVKLKDGPARALKARVIDEPHGLWPRVPPIRHRLNVADHWLEICIDEGRNRQIRRMTAAVGLPTLRLIRGAVGPWKLNSLKTGESRSISNADAWKALQQRR
jgi:23S rRNA pseudouridine2457 synthase